VLQALLWGFHNSRSGVCFPSYERRTSNAYVFRDPQTAEKAGFSSKSENPTGTQNQVVLDPVSAPTIDPSSPLERALARFATAIAAREAVM
jgi:hypothetical protein